MASLTSPSFADKRLNISPCIFQFVANGIATVSPIKDENGKKRTYEIENESG
jgi:hypothetical protein